MSPLIQIDSIANGSTDSWKLIETEGFGSESDPAKLLEYGSDDDCDYKRRPTKPGLSPTMYIEEFQRID